MKAENRDFVRSSGVMMTGAARALVFGKRRSSWGDGSAATVAKCTVVAADLDSASKIRAPPLLPAHAAASPGNIETV